MTTIFRSKYKLCLLGTLMSIATQVGANGFIWTTQSASGLGSAYAGAGARAEDASALQYNPASIVQLKSTSLSLGYIGAQTRVNYTDKASQTGVLQSDNQTLNDWHHLPNLYLSHALNDSWSVGLGVTRPFDYRLDYEDGWQGAAQVESFKLTGYQINPSLAWRISPKVAVGLGLNYQDFDARYSRVLGTVPPYSNQGLDLHSSGADWGVNLGVLLTPSDRTQVGISYRGNVKHDIAGVSFKIPDTLSISVSQRLNDRWEMLGDLSWTAWGSLDNLPTASGMSAASLNLRDTFRLALGTRYTVSKDFIWKLGLAYEQTPSKSDDRHPLVLPEANRIWLTTGLRYTWSALDAFDLGLAYLYSNEAHVLSNQSALGAGSVDGQFATRTWLMGLQYSHQF